MGRKYINIHCHIINLHFVPDNFLKTRAPIREKLLRRNITRWLARLITWLIPGKKYNKLHGMLSLFKTGIQDVTKTLIEEMDNADIQLAIPLMMDLEFASFHQKPEIPYRHQVELTARMATKYPGRIMPFVMIDPRRSNATEIIIEALERLGFLGIKMYPPLGYHPYHKAFFNENHVNAELGKLYRYCEKEQIPITTHCSPGGAYSNEVMRCPDLRRELTRPTSWGLVLKEFPKLRLNLAHFGGDFLDIADPETWSHEIREMLQRYENVYADIAYHNQALESKTTARYFETLTMLLADDSVKHKILFGTDWSMTRHTWVEKDYLQPFRDTLTEEQMEQIAVSNPTAFLFPGRKIPERVIQALAAKKTTFPQQALDYFKKIGVTVSN